MSLDGAAIFLQGSQRNQRLLGCHELMKTPCRKKGGVPFAKGDKSFSPLAKRIRGRLRGVIYHGTQRIPSGNVISSLRRLRGGDLPRHPTPLSI
jgi:hypothetical protein